MKNSRLISIAFTLIFLFGAIPILATQAYWSMEPSTHELERVDVQTGFDIIKYTIDLLINDVTQYIEGEVEAIVLAEENMSSIQYRMMGGSLSVNNVEVNGQSVAFTHSNGVIDIPLSVSAGTTFYTRVNYSGFPGLSPAPYNIGLKFTANSVYTLSNPEAGRYWWPCYDHPWDKALLDMNITVRSDWVVAANGTRTWISHPMDGTRTHHWSSAHPIATYVMGFAAGPFVEFNQYSGDIRIQNFVLPGQINNALQDFANVPEMISYFSSIFGPYPFEKYGHVVVSISPYAAMEHQTMTTFGSQYINGQQTYESIVAHELAHQWYGNLITPVHMGQAWLKECFAVYSEALWVHHHQGWEAAVAYIRSQIQQYYISWENNNGPHTIFEPPYNLMFAPPTYEKSASVLHMLRLKLGNADFFSFIQSLLTTYAHGNYDTDDFIALAEQISGQDLTQFFQQWIYSPGIPNADLAIFSNTANQVKVYARTSSPTATQFFLDIPLMLPQSAVCDSFVVQASPNGQINYFQLADGEEAANLQIDPNNWVLARVLNRETPQLTYCLPVDGLVALEWNPYLSMAQIEGYRVFRRELPGGSFVDVSTGLIEGTSFTDNSVVNGIQYEYYVVGIDDEGYMSLPSNRMQASPISFPFDLGFLVIDETRDGTGTAISPTDEMVDEFYRRVLAGFAFTEWDYASGGAPSLELVSRYPLILWHGDDFAQMLIYDNLDLIVSYVLSGGRIVISGWKYPSVLTQEFLSLFLPGIELNYHNSAVFISAQSDSYPTLIPDPQKLNAVWNGMLPQTYTFGGATNPLYTASISGGGIGDGAPAAIRIDHGGSMVLLGFPLYFMQEEGVHGFLQEYLPQLYPALSVSELTLIPSAPHLSCYPNPFNGSKSLSIKVSNASKITIYNIKGQKVHSQEIQNTAKIQEVRLGQEIISQLPTGCYLIRADSSTSSVTRKVIHLR